MPSDPHRVSSEHWCYLCRCEPISIILFNFCQCHGFGLLLTFSRRNWYLRRWIRSVMSYWSPFANVTLKSRPSVSALLSPPKIEAVYFDCDIYQRMNRLDCCASWGGFFIQQCQRMRQTLVSNFFPHVCSHRILSFLMCGQKSGLLDNDCLVPLPVVKCGQGRSSFE